MASEHLIFEYDVEGDIMFIAKCQPYPEQDEDDIEDMVVGRCHPHTNEVESIEIIFFATRVLSRNPLRLDIPIAQGAINGWPAAPEFDCLVQPGSPWLTIPPDAQIVDLYIPLRSDTPAPVPADAPAPAPMPTRTPA